MKKLFLIILFLFCSQIEAEERTVHGFKGVSWNTEFEIVNSNDDLFLIHIRDSIYFFEVNKFKNFIKESDDMDVILGFYDNKLISINVYMLGDSKAKDIFEKFIVKKYNKFEIEKLFDGVVCNLQDTTHLSYEFDFQLDQEENGEYIYNCVLNLISIKAQKMFADKKNMSIEQIPDDSF